MLPSINLPNNKVYPLVEGLKVEVERRESYGQERLYPSNHVARVICELLNQKTLTRHQLNVLGKIAAIHTIYVGHGA